MLTQLDEFLSGILVSPYPIMPGTWLKHIWAGEDGKGAPDFEDTEGFQHFVDLIMYHYNQILASLNQPGAYEPVFDIDTRNDDILSEMWVEGLCAGHGPGPRGLASRCCQ